MNRHKCTMCDGSGKNGLEKCYACNGLGTIWQEYEHWFSRGM